MIPATPNKYQSYDIVIRAPGRVCLYGDHQDYLGLPVIACTIDKQIYIYASRASDNFLEIELQDIDCKRRIDIYEIEHTTIDQGDYLLAAIHVLQRHGIRPTCGYRITISGDLAINAGLSSSSALTMGWITFLVSAFGNGHNPELTTIAEWAYETEVAYFRSGGGRMDQYTIALGQLLYLETTGNQEHTALDPPEFGMVIAESGIPKNTNKLLTHVKNNALQAILAIREEYPNFDLRAETPAEAVAYLHKTRQKLSTYLEAAVENYYITKNALQELSKKKPSILKLGSLMNQHHEVLSKKLDVSLPKIDRIVSASLSAGACGAKIVGSGRGGCIVAICTKGYEENVAQAMKTAGAVDAYPAYISKGIEVLKLNDRSRMV